MHSNRSIPSLGRIDAGWLWVVAPAAVAATTTVTGLFASPPPCLCVPNLVLVRGVAWRGATHLLPHLLLLPRIYIYIYISLSLSSR